MGETYRQMRDRQQKESNDFPFGFAFNDDQFYKMMKEWGLCNGRDGRPTKNDLKQIYRLPIGGSFIRKKDAPAMHEMFDRHEREMDEAIKADTDGTGFIFQMFCEEMRNHEYSYTGDLTDTLGALGLTGEEIEARPNLKAGLMKAQEVVLNEDCF